MKQVFLVSSTEMEEAGLDTENIVLIEALKKQGKAAEKILIQLFIQILIIKPHPT